MFKRDSSSMSVRNRNREQEWDPDLECNGETSTFSGPSGVIDRQVIRTKVYSTAADRITIKDSVSDEDFERVRTAGGNSTSEWDSPYAGILPKNPGARSRRPPSGR
ncbi:hypothetical protein EVAR_36409_1 [Eumeta japonica]|uniref:Uncharacterized protein n=1 Tax=Eumeta variegata TaxID=151549 RepID=A0A4C1VPT6_EUMVA|nr:hypothetical protein EVAR_36409_1 [Eumeta japonica]